MKMQKKWFWLSPDHKNTFLVPAKSMTPISISKKRGVWYAVEVTDSIFIESLEINNNKIIINEKDYKVVDKYIS